MAAVYDEGLGCGMFEINDVIQWSDNVIEVLDSPPFELIELSLMASRKIEDVKGKLTECHRYNGINIESVVNMLLAVISTELCNDHLDMEEAIKYSSKLLVGTGLYSRKEYYELYLCDDAYYLAAQGIYGYLKDVYNQFSSAIFQFKSFYTPFTDLYRTVMGAEWVRS